MTISRKTMMRTVCFAMAAALAMLCAAVWSGARAADYRRRLENAAVRSVREAASGMNALSVELKKSAYAGTPAQMAGLSAKIWKESSAVKTMLENLPSGETGLAGAYRFLSQVGDYSMYLSRRAADGIPPSDEDRRNIESLIKYSASMTESLRELEDMISSGEVKAHSLLGQDGKLPFLGQYKEVAGLKSVEAGFEGYPVLIYDGPFSDGPKSRASLAAKNAPRIGRDEARYIAADFADADATGLLSGGDEISETPSYTFYNQDITVGVTMDGGIVTYLSASRVPGENTLSIEQGRRLALQFLRERGMDSMTETGYELALGVLTVNFAYYQDGVVCYTDLVKVGVAMDNGEMILYDARDFIGSHRGRDLKAVPLPPEIAAKALSPSLEQESRRLALIPTPGGNEVLTWEFSCEGIDGEKVLVYVNAETGAEEKILILIESENGVLTV